MLKINEFDNYFLCLKTCRILRRKGDVLVPLKPSNKVTTENAFILYKNGVPRLLKFTEILKICKVEIAEFLKDSKTTIPEV